jgi:SAM-dependent methyltransferase
MFNPTLPAESVAAFPSRERGLVMALIFGRHLFKMQDLHYGYWPDDLAVEWVNFPQAQAAYTEFLVGAIPPSVKTILDVGCGAGNNALRLVEKGYLVDCVSPNGYLTEVAKQRLEGRAQVFECRIEELETDRRYDLILFSESLLFMPLEAALDKALALLNPGGDILITDVFKLPAEGKSPIGGGHRLPVFREVLARLHVEVIQDLDMTARIAPTFDLIGRASDEMIKPAYDLMRTRLGLYHPWISKFLQWKFRDSIEKYERKHFSGRRTGESFLKYKSYRLLLLRKNRNA